MDHFELVSEYEPTGDQPQAIEKLTKGFQDGNQFELLFYIPRVLITACICNNIDYDNSNDLNAAFPLPR